MASRRVVITGIGTVAPNGIGKDAFWEALADGRSGVRKVTYFDSSIYSSYLAGEVHGFDAKEFMPAKTIRRSDRSTHFLIAATRLALNDANLDITDEIKREMHCIVGTTLSGHTPYIDQLRTFFTKGYKSVSPIAAVSCFSDACSGQLAIMFGFKGAAETISAGCAASTNAVIDAYKRIKLSETSICIAGGTDAPLSEEIFCGFSLVKVLSQKKEKAPAPFDKNRDGTILSEGAGIMVVEELGHALKRNAPIYAEIIGYGMTTDAYHMTGPEPSAEERFRAIKMALSNAKVPPREVEYINAHGTGTRLNDSNETLAIKEVFGKYAYEIPISATKSLIGHSQGASGTLEIIATLLALKKGIIHPTINYETPDETCDLNYVPNKAIKKNINIAISNSFGFGGKNSIIVLKKYK